MSDYDEREDNPHDIIRQMRAARQPHRPPPAPVVLCRQLYGQDREPEWPHEPTRDELEAAEQQREMRAAHRRMMGLGRYR